MQARAEVGAFARVSRGGACGAGLCSVVDRGAPAQVVLGTYGYEPKEGVIYVDQCGMEETDQAVTIPHSLVDVAAMSLWKTAALSFVSES